MRQSNGVGTNSWAISRSVSRNRVPAAAASPGWSVTLTTPRENAESGCLRTSGNPRSRPTSGGAPR